MTDKATLRAEARKRRAVAHANVDPAPALDRLAEAIAATTGPVSFYWPIRTEIDPRPLMDGLSGTRDICLPVTIRIDFVIFLRFFDDYHGFF